MAEANRRFTVTVVDSIFTTYDVERTPEGEIVRVDESSTEQGYDYSLVTEIYPNGFENYLDSHYQEELFLELTSETKRVHFAAKRIP